MNKLTTLNRGILFKFQTAARSFESLTNTVWHALSTQTGQYKMRRIKSTDNQKVKDLIQKILLERGGLGIESLYYDQELTTLSESYQSDKSLFNVLTLDHEIVGTIGIAPTKSRSICEIKKLYLDKSCRSKGLGKIMFSRALKQAFKMGYHSCEVSIELRNESFYSFLLKNGFKEIPHKSNNPYEIQLLKSLN